MNRPVRGSSVKRIGRTPRYIPFPFTRVSFQFDYSSLEESCEDFATQLVDKCRTTDEVELVLSQKEGCELGDADDKYSRMLLAIEYDHKRVYDYLHFFETKLSMCFAA